MRKSTLIALSAMLFSAPVFAATTVTVDDNNRVTIDQNQPQTVAVVQAVPETVIVQTVPQTVVVQAQPYVVVEEAVDPRDLEGVITRVDLSDNMIMVEDAKGREKKVALKQGMVGNYKVGDYVQIHLMSGLKEALTIKTVGKADLEGEVVSADQTRNQIVVRDERGNDNVVVVSQEMNGKYQTGDHVRLYVVANSPTLREVRLIRVK